MLLRWLSIDHLVTLILDTCISLPHYLLFLSDYFVNTSLIYLLLIDRYWKKNPCAEIPTWSSGYVTNWTFNYLVRVRPHRPIRPVFHRSPSTLESRSGGSRSIPHTGLLRALWAPIPPFWPNHPRSNPLVAPSPALEPRISPIATLWPACTGLSYGCALILLSALAWTIVLISESLRGKSIRSISRREKSQKYLLQKRCTHSEHYESQGNLNQVTESIHLLN